MKELAAIIERFFRRLQHAKSLGGAMRIKERVSDVFDTVDFLIDDVDPYLTPTAWNPSSSFSTKLMTELKAQPTNALISFNMRLPACRKVTLLSPPALIQREAVIIGRKALPDCRQPNQSALRISLKPMRSLSALMIGPSS